MSMTPDPYRSAYEKALEDLSIISDRFETLNTRKRHAENLISALQPVFASDHYFAHENPTGTASSSDDYEETSAETQEPTSEAEESYTFLDVPAPLPAGDAIRSSAA